MLRNRGKWQSRPARARVILLVVAATCLSAGVAAATQPAASADPRRVELELQKLQLEIERLRDRPAPWWMSGVLGVVVGVGSTVGAVWVARRNQLGALDQSVHDQRLKTYPALVQAAERLAIYFPPYTDSEPMGPQQCEKMGRAMSLWYFRKGGLLLSEDSRPAYFLLARALTRASLAGRLNAPLFPRDAGAISSKNLDRYRYELGFPKAADEAYVEQWIFGQTTAREMSYAETFRDYVFLQWLSSTLRTTLSEDLRSRRRPAARESDDSST